MQKVLLIIVFIFNCYSLRAQTVKGLPQDITTAELLIVAYEPADLIPANAKSHEYIYSQQTPLQTQCAQANKQLAAVAKNAYPFRYRILSKQELAACTGEHAYIFEPARLYSQPTVWATTPLYLRDAASDLTYEIGYLPTHFIFFPDEIMKQLIQFLPKNLPVQASDKVVLKQ